MATITQVITAIPTAGHRGVDSRTVFVTKQEAFQDALTATTVTQLNTFATQANQLETNVNAKEVSATNQVTLATAQVALAAGQVSIAATHALSAQGSANYQGAWTSKGYTVGQTVSDTNGIRWLCKLTHTTAQTAVEGTYWTIAVPYVGAIGNINSPLLDMPLKNSLAMKAGVGSATFTRASTATYINRYGILKPATIDEPRFEKEGYLNEGASTNLLTYSQDFSNAIWATVGITSKTTDGTLSPDGVSLAFKVVSDGLSSEHFIDSTIPISSNITRNGSLFIKYNNVDTCSFSLYCTGGIAQSKTTNFTFSTKTLTNTTDFKVEELSGGWFRISGNNASISNTAFILRMYVGLSGITTQAGSVYVWGAQLESLPFATSYIPTVASAVTRAADILKVSMLNNSPKGTFAKTVLVDFLPKSLAQEDARIFDFQSINYNMIRIDANSIQSFYGAGTLTTYTPSLTAKTRWVYIVNNNIQDTSTNSISSYANGVLISTESSSAVGQSNIVPTSLIMIGSGQNASGTSPFNGHIANFRIYDKVLTAQEVALA